MKKSAADMYLGRCSLQREALAVTNLFLTKESNDSVKNADVSLEEAMNVLNKKRQTNFSFLNWATEFHCLNQNPVEEDPRNHLTDDACSTCLQRKGVRKY